MRQGLGNIQEIKGTLIERAISVMAKNGLDKTTTKTITLGTGINESYIYRYFDGKENLLAQAFAEIDEELLAKVMQSLPVMQMREVELELRCKILFLDVWNLMIQNKEHCLAFMQYYYSPYFLEYSAEAHAKRYRVLVERFKSAFREEADVWMILNHIFTTMLSFAVKVHNGEMSEEDNYTEHIFRVVFEAVKQYFREDMEL